MAFNESLFIRPEIKKTKKWEFLQKMDSVMPRNEIVDEIEKARKAKSTGRPSIDALLSIKIQCLQKWFNLSDPAAEEAIYDSAAIQKFLNIDITSDRIPDETTICRFRKFMQETGLHQKIFDIINRKLDEYGLICKEGTIVMQQ